MMQKVYTIIIVLGAISALCLIAMVDANEGKAEELVWGNPFKGVAISVRPSEKCFKLGQDMEILVSARNFAEDEVLIVREAGVWENFRAVLFDQDGRPVAKSKAVEEFEASIGKVSDLPISGSGRSPTRIKPGETSETQEVLRLNDWFKVDKEGTYFLVVMRQLWSWDKGFMISNMAKITIAK